MTPQPSAGYLIAVVAVGAAVTWALRSIPFMVLAPLRQNALLPFLNRHMPAGMMVILVIYTLASAVSVSPGRRPALALLVAVFVTVAVHLWRRNFVLGILAGTSVHVVLASTVLGA